MKICNNKKLGHHSQYPRSPMCCLVSRPLLLPPFLPLQRRYRRASFGSLDLVTSSKKGSGGGGDDDDDDDDDTPLTRATRPSPQG